MIPSIYIPIIGLDKFTPELTKSLKQVEKVGSTINGIGKKMTMFATLPIVGAGVAATKFATDLNKSMGNVQTLIPESLDRIKELKTGVQDLSIATGKGTGDIADGLYQVISAFGDSADTAKTLEVNTKAAVAGISTVTDSINLTSAVTKAYGDTSASAMAKVADMSFMTVKLGQTTFPELANSIGNVTPLAGSMGVQLEELFGVMSTATGVTGNASVVSTQFRGILAAMAKPTGELASLFEHLGFKSGEAMIQQMGFGKSVKTIVDMAKAADVPLGKLLGRVEAQTLAISLAGSLSDKYTEKLGAMGNAAGALEEAFAAQTEGINKVGFTMEKAKQRFIVIAQRMGDILLPVVEKLLNFVEPLVGWLEKISPAMLKTIAAVGAVVAAIGPFLAIVGFLTMKIAAFMSWIGAMGGIAAILSNPIGWVIGAIIGVIAAVSALFLIIKKLKLGFLETVAGILAGSNPLGAVMMWVISRWKRILPFVKLLVIGIAAVLKRLASVLLVIFKPILMFFELLGKAIFFVLDTALSGLEKLANLALPEWVKKKIGLTGAGTGGASAVTERTAASMRVEQNQSFEGKLTFENMPAGARFEQTKGEGKGLDIDMGYSFAGAQ